MFSARRPLTWVPRIFLETPVSTDGQADISEPVVNKSLRETGEAVHVSVGRRAALVGLELTVLLACCVGIVVVWESRNPPAMWFAIMVALILFASNSVCGTYRQTVYMHHVARLARSALAHGLGGVALAVPMVVWFENSMEFGYLLGMVIMSFFITNTLRPVLVEVLRAGNKLDQRRKPDGIGLS